MTERRQGPKVSHQRWIYAKALMGAARDSLGLSLTDLSRAVKGHGDTPGWAKAALDYQYNVTERDIARLEELAGVPKPHKGLRTGDHYLSNDGKRKLAGLIETLRTRYKFNNTQLGAMLGVSPNNIARLANGSGGSVDMATRSQDILDRMQRIETEEGEAEGVAGPGPGPEPVEEAAPQKKANGHAPEAEFGAGLGRVRERLLDAAVELEQYMATLPALFRPPLKEFGADIVKLAERLEEK